MFGTRDHLWKRGSAEVLRGLLGCIGSFPTAAIEVGVGDAEIAILILLCRQCAGQSSIGAKSGRLRSTRCAKRELHYEDRLGSGFRKAGFTPGCLPGRKGAPSDRGGH